ncbi:transcriptional regulator, LacI family [Beutenbergia cavernae DSM 12333]|uniref:Transcriptional regulator, LacI family n=1 Tax=Beutenbergia cavernae (strain ATCC BAA-8 / DSM 12333 / CCUG 43141 / JCM 11478 / NBRC 16432 / NCIMB 13614 / HKI 0122) TaxID=471853 RepID=C5C216_BEUC1|nr:LacI family DNA-binding transcriptional regulator [Beutenbergia cavernae]ACQ81641.1 transcriptional regulator, LacI family [Beutenbergia cavernae DSM 12333]
MSPERPGVREIARLAGVSTATVSRVYRGVGQVSPEMRERVLSAIETHGYRPSSFGRALSRRRHEAVGIVFPGLSGPYFAELIQGFEAVALEARASVHVVGTHLLRSADADVRALADHVDGIAVHAGTLPSEVVDELAELMPLVVLGATPDERHTSVRTDHAPVLDLVEHLITDHGLRDLVFFGDPDGPPDVAARWDGFRAAHERHGLVPVREPLDLGLAFDDGLLAADAVLAPEHRRIDGVVCANDETALGFLMGALGRGVRVPEDVVVVGIDDVPMSSVVRPALTTVARPLRELAETSARLLLDLVEGRDVPGETVLPSSLVIRTSCGCPPAAPAPA